MRITPRLCNSNAANRVKGLPRYGQIWAAAVAFEEGAPVKRRPVLILGREGNLYRCAPCTTKCRGYDRRYPIRGLVQACLERQTYIEYHTVLIPAKDLKYQIGSLSGLDLKGYMQAVAQ